MNERWKAVCWLAAGLFIGQAAGPVAAWAADRVEVNWPSVFKIAADRTWPVKVEAPVEVRVDRYNLPELKVHVESLPPVKVEERRATGWSYAPLRETPEATVFVAGRDDQARVLRLDHTTGFVSEVSRFEL